MAVGFGVHLRALEFRKFRLSNMQIFSPFLGSFFKTCMCMSNRYTCCRVVRISRLVPPRGSHKGHYCAPYSSRADWFDPVTLVFMRGAHARLTGDTVMWPYGLTSIHQSAVCPSHLGSLRSGRIRVFPKFSTCIVSIRARSHLATTTQIFDIVTVSSEMGCIVINVTVRKWRWKKTHRCRQV